MKFLVNSCLVCSFLLFFEQLYAQGSFNSIFEKHGKTIGISEKDMESFVEDYMYTDQNTGITHYYLQQTIDGIPVRNSMLILATKNDVLGHVANNSIKNIHKATLISKQSISETAAIVMGAVHLGVIRPEVPSSLRGSSADERYNEYSKTSYTKSSIKTRPIYENVGGSLVLCHEVILEMAESADYWSLSVSQEDGKVVAKHNFTISCQFENGAFKHSNVCSHKEDCIELGLKMEDGNTQIQESQSLGASQMTPKYRVYPLPIESPIHGNAVLLDDPSDKGASREGWNVIDGVTYNRTRGNNTHVFLDENDDNLPDPNTEVKPTQALVFDFVHDKSRDPAFSSEAAQTNLFYAINRLHDITYYYGFDEVAGNFQQKNYTNTGRGNDQVNGQVFDGNKANPRKLNNATFSAPVDGSTGIMQMYLWAQLGAALKVITPTDAQKDFTQFGTANFGFPLPSVTEPAIIGEAVIATDATQNAAQVCTTPNIDLKGKIALVNRGNCDFSLKVFNAQQAGAIACVICNVVGVSGGNGEETVSMGAGANATQVTIPSIFLPKSSCDYIRALINKGLKPTLKLQTDSINGANYRDASFDNGIIAHEFGHGVSIRLTGGPNNSSCLGNDEQMGEGWSDFFSLVTTVKPGDKDADIRGIGTYALGEDIDGIGIRRYPYSTDMKVNPLTYKDIKGTAGPHAVGEVWACMLWELYWKMVEKYGFDPDLKNIKSGNGIAISLVMEGMKLQACRPGFIEGRDAILGADLLLYGGANTCLIWDAFAKRGLGVNAAGGSTADRNDGIENFEPLATCIEKLKIVKKLPNTVNANEVVEVNLSAINHVKKELNNVAIEDELPAGSQYVAGSASVPTTVVNGKLVLSLGTMPYNEPRSISYKLIMPSIKSKTIKINTVDNGVDDFQLEPIQGTDTWRTTTVFANSGKESWYIESTPNQNDHALISPLYNVTGQKPTFRFFHRYDTQPVNDGGFVQISTDQGNSWEFINDKWILNGPKDDLSYSTFAIPNLKGFTGSTKGAWVDSYVDLNAYKGKSILFRFRYGSDTSGVMPNGSGWYIDDMELMDLVTGTSLACIDDETKQNKACTAGNSFIINSDMVSSEISEKIEPIGVQIFPNPTNSKINIQFKIDDNIDEAKISIIAIDGRVARTKSISGTIINSIHQMDVNDLPNGLYQVLVQSGIHVVTKKIIIQK